MFTAILFLKKICLLQWHESMPTLSSRKFIILTFTFKSMLYIKLIFVYSVKKGKVVFFFFFGICLSSHSSMIYSVDLPYSLIALALLLKSICIICLGLFLDFLFCSVDLFIFVLPNNKYTNLLDYYIINILKL